MSGSLIVVGTGYNVAGHVTPEARASIETADRFFYLVTDPVTSAWLKTLHATAEPLHDAYRAGEPGLEACERMVERVLAAVRAGHRTCVAFYGHPAICVPPGLESVRRARQEGFPARMLPAVSFEDCLFADLGLDPGVSGRVLYEATDFLIRPRTFDPTASLILLQVGVIGLVDFRPGDTPNRAGLRILGEVLLQHYPAEHPVVLYRASQLPIFAPGIDRVPLSKLDEAPLSVMSTLYVPAMPKRRIERGILARLKEMAVADSGRP